MNALASVATGRPRGRPRKAPEALDDGNRRQAVLQQAARLFRHQGYAATTTRDIASAVGMRSGSPFYHFASKSALLFAVIEQGMHAALQRQSYALAALPLRCSAERRLRALIRVHFDVLLGPGSDFVPVMLYDGRSLERSQRERIAGLQREYEASWSQALRALQAQGRLRADARFARLFMLGALNWSVQWYKPGQGATLDDLAASAAALFLPSSRANAASKGEPT